MNKLTKSHYVYNHMLADFPLEEDKAMHLGKRTYTFVFWQQWLFVTSLLFAIAGMLLAVSGFVAENVLIDRFLQQNLFKSLELSSDVRLFRSYILGPLGGTMACCYLLLSFIAYTPFKRKEKWSRNAILVSFLVWVVLDSSICLYFGVYIQVYLINAFSAAIKFLPLLFTWKHFSQN